MIFMPSYMQRSSLLSFARFFSKQKTTKKTWDEKTIKAARIAFQEGCKKTLQEIDQDPEKLIYNYLAVDDPEVEKFLERIERQRKNVHNRS